MTQRRKGARAQSMDWGMAAVYSLYGGIGVVLKEFVPGLPLGVGLCYAGWR